MLSDEDKLSFVANGTRYCRGCCHRIRFHPAQCKNPNCPSGRKAKKIEQCLFLRDSEMMGSGTINGGTYVLLIPHSWRGEMIAEFKRRFNHRLPDESQFDDLLQDKVFQVRFKWSSNIEIPYLKAT